MLRHDPQSRVAFFGLYLVVPIVHDLKRSSSCSKIRCAFPRLYLCQSDSLLVMLSKWCDFGKLFRWLSSRCFEQRVPWIGVWFRVDHACHSWAHCGADKTMSRFRVDIVPLDGIGLRGYLMGKIGLFWIASHLAESMDWAYFPFVNGIQQASWVEIFPVPSFSRIPKVIHDGPGFRATGCSGMEIRIPLALRSKHRSNQTWLRISTCMLVRRSITIAA